MKTKTKEISIVEEITPEIDLINVPKIVDEKSLTNATEVLSQANTFLKRVVAYKETKTKPLNEALKIIRAETKPLETKLENIIETIRESMSKYQTEKIRLQKLAEDNIANKVAEGKIKAETGIRKLENMDKPVERVATNTGKISFKEVKKFEVMDITLLPKEYIIANETAIRSAMNINIELPGVRYFTEQIPINNLR